jgi:hypothetical protein
MNKIFAFDRMGHACALALIAALAAPASAAEPALLDANELSRVPVVDVSKQLVSVPALEARRDRLAIGGDTVEAVDLEKLDGERGRADTVLNDTRLNGDVANNNAVNVNTGSNTIDAGSFANMSGIPVVIQNSGANVLIQNATVINLQFQ